MGVAGNVYRCQEGEWEKQQRKTDKMQLASAQKGERTEEEGREGRIHMRREHQRNQLLRRKNPNGEKGSDV